MSPSKTGSIDTSIRNHYDPDNKVLVLRQSAIQAFLDCRRKFMWEYVKGIEPAYTQTQRPWTTPDVGTAFHLGMEMYYNNIPWAQALEDWFNERFGAGLRHEKEHAKGMEKVGIMIAGHIADLAADGADVGEETIATEHQLSTTFQVMDWDVTVTGQIDRVVRDLETGHLIIEDTKTTDSLDTTLQYIQQLGRYAVLYRIETGEAAARVRSNQVKRVMRTKAGPFYSRPWIPMNEAAYDAHWTSLQDTLADIIRCYSEERWYERVSKDCSWKCRVRDVCIAQQHGDDHETVVELFFREKGSVNG